MKRLRHPIREPFGKAGLIAPLALVALALILLVAPALATAAPLPTHHSLGSLASTGVVKPFAVAVDQSTGDILVAGKEAGTIERFHEDGSDSEFHATGSNALPGFTFGSSGQVQVAVDSSGGATDGNIYVAQSKTAKELKIFDSEGNALTTLTGYKAGPNGEGAETAFAEGICGVAVGAEGSLYVAEYGTAGQIHKYEPSGAVPTAADNTLNITVKNPCALAAGAGPTAGSLFAVASPTFLQETVKFNASTGAQDYAISGVTGTVAVDPVTGHLYTGTTTLIEYDATGESGATKVSTTTLAGSATGIAANGGTGNVYTARSTDEHVEVWGVGFAHAVTVHPTGSGHVSQTGGSEAISGAISECAAASGECSAMYYAWEGPRLTATADPNNEFKEWTSVEQAAGTTCSGTTNPCTIETDGTPLNGGSDVAAAVEFVPSGFELTVVANGSGEGTVTGGSSGEPGTIDCGTGGTNCSHLYTGSELVTLTGTPEGGHTEAVEWSGCDSVNGSNECEVTMSAAKNVTATFALETFDLEVEVGGTGTGEVTSDPAGIACSSGTCDEAFDYDTLVTLTGTATGGHTEAVEWSGCDSVNGSNECEVTMSAAKDIVATFEAEPGAASLTIGKGGNGEGTVKSAPAGINCGPGCEGVFAEGQTVSLTAEAAEPGSIFLGWSANCTPTSLTECEAEVKAGGTFVAATFAAVPVLTEFDGEHEPLGAPCGGNGGTETDYAGSTTYVCNGHQGVDGEAGKDMVVGTATAAECPEGGITVEVEGEPSTKKAICNGHQGVDGEAGKDIVVGTATAAECPEGGITVEVEGEPSTKKAVCDGEMGPRGEEGEKGERGQIGIAGPEGPVGATGSQGPAGPTGQSGPSGAQGAPGAQGPEGKTGKQGKRGPAGKSAKVTCKVRYKKHGKKVKVTCAVKYKGGKASGSRLHWRLTKGGHVQNQGTTSLARLNRVLGHLGPGRYVLHAAGERTVLRVPSHRGHHVHHRAG